MVVTRHGGDVEVAMAALNTVQSIKVCRAVLAPDDVAGRSLFDGPV